MLPAHHRLVDSDAFRVTVRSGHRSGARTLVVHLDRSEPDQPDQPDQPVRAGFVVSKAVGNAVVRNRVKRRLRHLTREHLPSLQGLSGSAVLVVRALPASATASYAELGADLDRCLSRVMS